MRTGGVSHLCGMSSRYKRREEAAEREGLCDINKLAEGCKLLYLSFLIDRSCSTSRGFLYKWIIVVPSDSTVVGKFASDVREQIRRKDDTEQSRTWNKAVGT